MLFSYPKEGDTILKLRYTNETGQSIYFGDDYPVKVENGVPSFHFKQDTNFYFISQQGMDGASADALLLKSPFQKGQTKRGININERVVTIQACLAVHELGNEAKEVERLRREAISVLNPLKNGTLEIYGDTFAKAFPDVQIIEGPTFKDEDCNEPDGILPFQFTCVVPSNFLTDLNYIVFDLVEVEPKFEFILEFGSSIEFGNMTNGGVTFVNDGDVEAPVIFEIPGPTLTPSITNKTTGEFIQVNLPIKANETMIINTSFGNKTVIIRDDTGKERNAFHYVDLASTFFQLPVGENFLRFRAEEGNDTAKIKVYYKRLYLGI